MATYFGDLQHTALVKQSLAPVASLVASANGLGADMILGDGNNFSVIANFGVHDITGVNSYVINVTESDDNVTFIPLATPCSITLNSASPAPPTPGNSGCRAAWGMRSKRYLRAEVVISGGSAAIAGLSVIFIEKLKIAGVGGGYAA